MNTEQNRFLTWTNCKHILEGNTPFTYIREIALLNVGYLISNAIVEGCLMISDAIKYSKQKESISRNPI